MWNNFKNTGSTDKSNIPPGAIVVGSGAGSDGAIYGHVGIYLGNNMVAQNIGRHDVCSLERWISLDGSRKRRSKNNGYCKKN